MHKKSRRYNRQWKAAKSVTDIKSIVDTSIILGYRRRVAIIRSGLECQIKRVAVMARNGPQPT